MTPFVLYKKVIFLLSFFSVFFTGCFSVKDSARFTYKKLESSQYQQMLIDSSNAILIDVRTKGEYKKAHLPNAINNSYLSFRYKTMVNSINRDKLVFVYCQTCHRSPLAARKMKRMGFRKVYDLKGGFAKFKNN